MEDNGEKNGLISLLSPFDYHIHTLWWLYVSSQKLPIQEYNLYSFFSVYQRLKLNNSSACRFCHPTSSLLTQKQAVSVIQNNLHEGMSFIFDFLEEKSLYLWNIPSWRFLVESLDSLFLASFDVTHAHIDGKKLSPADWTHSTRFPYDRICLTHIRD